jgi:ubiquinone/menaquinone biosynthesis C-methylase UbiE
VTAVKARYDGLAVWYDEVMRDPANRGGLASSAYEALADLLGAGTGTVLDIGCGTGLAAERIRRLGYRPFGIDISFDQLRVAAGRLPAAQGDAAVLPIASGRVPLAYSTFVSSDLDDFAGAVSEAFRVLQPGGRYISVCVHPCLNGGYSDLQPDGSVVVRAGYEATGYQPQSDFRTTIRSHVGAWHRPLAETVNTFLESGFRLIRLTEIGPATLPSLLGITVEKP